VCYLEALILHAEGFVALASKGQPPLWRRLAREVGTLHAPTARGPHATPVRKHWRLAQSDGDRWSSCFTTSASKGDACQRWAYLHSLPASSQLHSCQQVPCWSLRLAPRRDPARQEAFRVTEQSPPDQLSCMASPTSRSTLAVQQQGREPAGSQFMAEQRLVCKKPAAPCWLFHHAFGCIAQVHPKACHQD
jgi:hypothetical protein